MDFETTPISVRQYIDEVNYQLKELGKKRIIGEITKVSFRTHYYFTLKDKADGTILESVIWASNYKMCGVELVEGQEIIVYGEADIYPLYGRFLFKAQTIELYGEGVLKAAYEKMLKKLEAEGLFSEERKRPLPKYVKKIGLITSKNGDAIFDFRTNLGKFGFEITFMDSRVEGQLAVAQLLSCIKSFRNKDIDVLVLVRGGGSLESLQAYNNESIIRELAQFPKPVLTGIGHEKDITLADLVADRRESTPTGAAKALNVSWELLINKIRESRERIRNQFENSLQQKKRELARSFHSIKSEFRRVIDAYSQSKERVRSYISETLYKVKQWRSDLSSDWSLIKTTTRNQMKEVSTYVEQTGVQINLRNPMNQLRLGYSLVRLHGKVIKNVGQLKKDDVVEIEVADGSVESIIQKVNKK